MREPFYQNKVVWITGASSGIGEALAHQLSMRGAKLALSGRNIEALNKLKNALTTEANIYAFDVADKKATCDTVDAIIRDFKKIDLAILNAGISQHADLESFASSFEPLMQVNVLGPVYAIDALLKIFLPINKGHIATISSLASLGGLPKAAAYCASKSALKAIFESLQIDLSKTNIKTSIIFPGFIKTPLTDKNDFKMPFLMSAKKAAKIMADRLAKEEPQIYFPRFFAFMIRAVNLLPNFLYVKLMSRLR